MPDYEYRCRDESGAEMIGDIIAEDIVKAAEKVKRRHPGARDLVLVEKPSRFWQPDPPPRGSSRKR